MFFFFFNDTATTEIYTLSLHDALPICMLAVLSSLTGRQDILYLDREDHASLYDGARLSFGTMRKYRHNDLEDLERLRSEEHTSELQSRQYLVCRLLLEKKKKMKIIKNI